MTVSQFKRRDVLTFMTASALYAGLPFRAALAALSSEDPAQRLAEIERRAGGRLGVFVLDGERPDEAFGHRADERFALCSTFKVLLAAAVLREAERGRLDLDESLPFGEADLVAHSPMVGAQLERGHMRIVELAEATQLTSDNAAANLLLTRLGGPAAFTALLREMGDDVTRIDRIEPAMNLVPTGELRDTSTPVAMAKILARLFSGEVLGPEAQARLKAWMIATQTGLKRLRGGFPTDWVAGDKTGTGISPGMANKHNDVAVIWRPGRAPLTVAAYYEADGHYPGMRPQDDAVLADVGRLVSAVAGAGK